MIGENKSSHIVSYHADVRDKDLPLIPKNMQVRIRRAIEERLQIDPIHYGDAHKKNLHGYRKMHVREYRVIYRLEQQHIIIFVIRHRR